VVWLDLPHWYRWDPFLADPGVQSSALGLVFTLVLVAVGFLLASLVPTVLSVGQTFGLAG
jgi:hypothetical protein